MVKQRPFYTLVTVFGFIVLVFLGCGKKGDPIPLQKGPLFSTENNEGAAHNLINQEEDKKEQHNIPSEVK